MTSRLKPGRENDKCSEIFDVSRSLCQCCTKVDFNEVSLTVLGRGTEGEKETSALEDKKNQVG